MPIGPRASAYDAIAAYFGTIPGLSGVRGWPQFGRGRSVCAGANLGNGKGLVAVVHVSEDRMNCSPKLIGSVDELPGSVRSVQTYRIGWLRLTARLELWTTSRSDRDRFEYLIEEAIAPDVPQNSVGVLLTSEGYHDRNVELLLGPATVEDGADSAARGEYRLSWDLDVSTDLVRVQRGPGFEKQVSITATVTTTEQGTDVVESTVLP